MCLEILFLLANFRAAIIRRLFCKLPLRSLLFVCIASAAKPCFSQIVPLLPRHLQYVSSAPLLVLGALCGNVLTLGFSRVFSVSELALSS
jgi:hypothetical protein